VTISEEKIEKLKIEFNRVIGIRASGMHMHWPKDFKHQVLSILKEGLPSRVLSGEVGLSATTLKHWIKREKLRELKSFKFSEVKIVEPPKKTSRHFTLKGFRGVEVTGFELSDIMALLREGLI
jgi:hypothetical protein